MKNKFLFLFVLFVFMNSVSSMITEHGDMGLADSGHWIKKLSGVNCVETIECRTDSLLKHNVNHNHNLGLENKIDSFYEFSVGDLILVFSDGNLLHWIQSNDTLTNLTHHITEKDLLNNYGNYISKTPDPAIDPFNPPAYAEGAYSYAITQSFNATYTKINTILKLSADNITYGGTTNITANLIANGQPVVNKNISFNINGTNYTIITDEFGMATFNFTPPHAGSYNVTANFNGDTDYNPSTNSTIFVAKLNTSLSIVKTVNNNNPNINDSISYTINVKNDGTIINSPCLVRDYLPEGLEYEHSNSDAGSYDHSTGIWTIPRLGSGETATLNITVKCKSIGNIANTAFLVLNDYNNNGTNDSSVQITVISFDNVSATPLTQTFELTTYFQDTGNKYIADEGEIKFQKKINLNKIKIN
ncbi:MAG: Pseudogene of DUF11 domain-containing protein [Methanobrevibacter sp. CfCl-M3]